MPRSCLVAFVFPLGAVACAGAPAEPAKPAPIVPVVAPEAPEPAPIADAAEPDAAAEPEPSCESDHVWDEAEKACRLFPGGGYGWAGCSQAKAPPNGEQCVTGTHWQSCDCLCDTAGTRWNADDKRCE
jgi:hypothetical protein